MMNVAKGRKKFFLITFVLFLVAMPWLYRGFYDPSTGEVQVFWILMTAVSWVLLALISFMKWEGGALPEFGDWYGLLFQEIGLLGISAGCLAIFCAFSVGEYELSLWFVVSNLLPIYVLVRVIFLAARSLLLTSTGAGIVSMVFAGVNFYVYQFRARPIYPWDLFSVGTAAAVVEDYQIVAYIQLIAAYLIFVLVHQLITFLPQARVSAEKGKWRTMKRVGANLAVILGIVFVYVGGVMPQFSPNIWTVIFNSSKNGTVASFISYLPWAVLEKPEGYSKTEAEKTLEEIGQMEADPERITATNIIMIMNESMSDYEVFSSDALTEDYMPFFHSLQENTVRGNLYVSCYGGNTCDTEFESLTGNSILYAPNTPFETQFHHAVPSIVSSLKDQEFSADAMHPMSGEDWNRAQVYEYLGFDTFTTIDDLPREERLYLRNNYSDEADFDWIIEKFDEDDQQEKRFLFNVTMQNHGGYGEETLNDRWSVDVDLSEVGDYPQAELFFSLMKETDQAIEKLITYFSQVDEPTIICIYGDHQPDLQDGFLDVLYGKTQKEVTTQERQMKYTTPFVIWANYDIEEAYIPRMSANYLGAMLMKYANADLDEYQNFLLQLYEKYPVISSTGIIDSDGTYYESPEEADSDEIRTYQKLQYYRMKDASLR